MLRSLASLLPNEVIEGKLADWEEQVIRPAIKSLGIVSESVGHLIEGMR